MPIKQVIREKIIIEEHVTQVVCNACGREGTIEGAGGAVPQWPAGFHVWDLEGGWGDTYPGDMERFQIVSCEECLRAWVSTFKHPDVFAGHRMGWEHVPAPVRHSETGEELDVLFGWVVARNGILPAGLDWDRANSNMHGEWPGMCPVDGSVWEHFKGCRYLVHGIVFMVGPETPMVMYQGLYGDSDAWVRPLDMWYDTIERDDYHGPRFRQLRGGIDEGGVDE